jgi:hypothetical protein
VSGYFYGISRMALINSANYSHGELPLAMTLSLSGENNIGKSSSINALQFLFLGDLREMVFPGKTSDASKKHYFPTTESYVLAELNTRNGMFVIGAAGRGVGSGYDFQLFAYEGGLDLEDYYDEEGYPRDLKKLEKHLATRDIWVKELQRKEMRDALMGKAVPVDGKPFTIGMITLRNATDTNYKLFMQVFRNLLHLSLVHSSELKGLFIDIYQPQGQVDLMEEYRRITYEVDNIKREHQIKLAITPLVNDLIERNVQRLHNIGYLRALYPRLTEQYRLYMDGYDESMNVLEARKQERLAQLDEHVTAIKGYWDEHNQKHDALKAEMEWHEQLASLENRFALVGDRGVISTSMEDAKQHYARCAANVHTAQSRTLHALENEHREILGQKVQDEQVLANIGDNLYRRLVDWLSPEDAQYVARLINSHVLSLPVTGGAITTLDEEHLKKWLAGLVSNIEGGIFHMDGIRICLTDLTPISLERYLNCDILVEEIEQKQQRLGELEAAITTAKEMEAAKKQADEAMSAFAAAQQELDAYDRLLTMREAKSPHTLQLQAAEVSYKAIKHHFEEANGAKTNLQREIEQINHEFEKRQITRNTIQTKYNLMRDVPIDEVEGTPYFGKPASHLEELLTLYLDMYTETYGAKGGRNGLIKEIEEKLELIDAKGGSRFIRGDQPIDNKIEQLKEMVGALGESELMVRKHEDSAMKELGSRVKSLLDHYAKFRQKIQKLNKEIALRSISNLKQLSFEPRETALYSHIEQLSRAEGLFADLDAARPALEALAEQNKGGLSLAGLFDLEIVVTQASGEQIRYPGLEVESNGTGITVKVLVNMLLLAELRHASKEGVTNIPIYVDEAADLSEQNQRNIIDLGKQFGFVTILASVKPQQVADYWVGLQQQSDGKIYVDRDDWFNLKRRREEEENNGHKSAVPALA